MEELNVIMEMMRLFALKERANTEKWGVRKTMGICELDLESCRLWLSLFYRNKIEEMILKIEDAYEKECR